MLTQMRNASKGFLATILVGLLILSFGAWGINRVFMPTPSDAVAKVGDTKIEVGEFLSEFTRVLDQQGRQTGRHITPQDASRMGLDKLFLEQMITRTALEVVVDDLGLTTPNSVLNEMIKSNEAFQTLSGDFDRQTYRDVLERNRLNEAMYEDGMRRDLSRQQLINSVAGGIDLPRGMIEARYKYIAEKRSASYLTLKPELAGKIPDPDEKTLSAFLKSHAARYTAPEIRSFTYVLLRPKDIASQVEIADEDVTREYESHKEQYVKPETREVRQIRYPTQGEALAGLKKIKAGASFLAVAREAGLPPEQVNLGNLPKEEFLVPAVGEAAFALAKPGLTDVVKGAFGFYIAEVLSITPSTTQTLDDVRASLQERIAMNAAAGRVEEIRGEFEDALAAESGSLEEIAGKLGLKAVKVEGVDQTGNTANGQRPAALPSEPDVLRAAFVNEEGEDPGFERLSTDGYFVVRIDDVKPSALRPLDKIRERVTKDWRADQVHQRLEKLARDLAARVNKGEKLSDIAGEYNLSVLTTRPPVQRSGIGTDLFSKEVLKDLFAANPGQAVSGPVRNGESYLVVTLRDIQPPDLSNAQARAALTEQMGRFNQEYGLALLDQYGLTLRKELGVKRYENVLAQAISEAR